MPHALDTLALPLFVPADRPERYAKAFAAGAKAAARKALIEAREVVAGAGLPVLLRINARGTPHHEADIAVARQLRCLAGVMLAEAEGAHGVEAVADVTGRPVLALIESARGLATARAIAEAGARLAFGSIDFAADLGCAHTRDALLFARSELVLTSRLGGRPAPLDGVTTSVKDETTIAGHARYAASLGMGGKLLIHPAQIGPAKAGLRPSEEEVAWADRVLATGDGAAALDGTMVDAPVRLRAEQVRRRTRLFQ